MKDLATKKDKDLLSMLTERKRELQDFGFSLAKGKPGERSPQVIKREIARILTEMSSRNEA